MSIKALSAKEINAYKDSTIQILTQQKIMLQKLDSELVKEVAHKKVGEEKKGILTLKKSKDFQTILQSEITKLQNFDVVLAVVGTMKAGKSTTINAIVGREILPNRNRPMTALPTLICHNPSKQVPSISINPDVLNKFLDELKEKLHLVPKSEAMHEDMKQLIDFVNSGGQFHTDYEGEEKIFSFLYQLNDLVRLTKEINIIQQNNKENEIIKFPFEEYKNFENLPRIDVAFNLESDFETQGRFMLLDTAGPNEAGQDELKEALAQQLARSSAVMLVLDYTQLSGDAEKSVKDQIEKIPTVQKSRLFALVNKFDQQNSNADEAEATCNNIYHKLLKDKIELNNIYTISASNHYLANRMKNYIDEYNSIPPYQKNTWVADFAKKIFGEMAELTYPNATVDMLKMGLELMIKTGRMQAPMQNVIGNMQKNAPFIAMQSALAGSSRVFDNLYNSLNARYAIQQKNTQEELDTLHQTAEKLKGQLKDLEFKQAEISDAIWEIKKNIEEETNLEERVKDAKESIEKEITALVSNHQQYIEQRSKAIDTRIYFMESYVERKERLKRENEKTELTTLAQITSEKNEIVFRKDNDDAEKFQVSLGNFLRDNIVRGIAEGFQGLMNQQTANAKIQLTDISDEAIHLLKSMRKNFNEDGISLRINFDLFNSIASPILNLNNLGLSGITQEFSRTYEKSGTISKIARWLSKDWGRYTVDYIYYNKTDLIKLLNDMINSIIDAIKAQVETQLTNLLQESMSYIENFMLTIQDIVIEIESELKNDTLRSIDEKKAYKTLIDHSMQEINNLKTDWVKLADIFDVKEIKEVV